MNLPEIERLTEDELGQIQIVDLIWEFLDAWNYAPELQHLTRVFSLDMELDHLANSGPREQGVHHASGLHLGDDKPKICTRRLAYSVRHEVSSAAHWKPKMYSVFETGKDTHKKVQGWIAFMFGDDAECEVQMRIDDMEVVGHCDVVLQLQVRGPYGTRKIRIGLEIKTIGEDYYRTKVKNRPLPKHLDQGAVYATALGLSAVVFIYENKNRQELRQHVCPYHDMLRERWENIARHTELINQHLRQGTLPPPKPSKWECGGCAFQVPCRPTIAKKKRARRTIPPAKLLAKIGGANAGHKEGT